MSSFKKKVIPKKKQNSKVFVYCKSCKAGDPVISINNHAPKGPTGLTIYTEDFV